VTVTDVQGFVAGGVAAGIKASGAPDMAIVATDDGRPAAAAGVFTSNKMTAAPVMVCLEHLSATGGRAAAVILNSGNANAATGEDGLVDARRMCHATAAEIGCQPDEVLVCSTGLIGFRLPMDTILAGIPTVAAARHADGGPDAARAMMTTDTVPKHALAVRRNADGSTFQVGGIAKGAAMLQPNMATMLAVLTTDAAVEPTELYEALAAGVGVSFNCLTVDGAQSTNDTVLLLANGRAGDPDPGAFADAVTEVCKSLAVQMADDAEGSTKTVFIHVSSANDDAEAATIARSIANCQLVKCSWYGQDPYWGRIASETGSSADHFDPYTLRIRYGDHVVYHAGPVTPVEDPDLRAYMTQRTLHLFVELNQGEGAADIVTTDLSHAYIDENMGTS
jgi:glutamate N-acetyltransferase / amino-acid N-acetyltransferase